MTKPGNAGFTPAGAMSLRLHPPLEVCHLSLFIICSLPALDEKTLMTSLWHHQGYFGRLYKAPPAPKRILFTASSHRWWITRCLLIQVWSFNHRIAPVCPSIHNHLISEVYIEGQFARKTKIQSIQPYFGFVSWFVLRHIKKTKHKYGRQTARPGKSKLPEAC